MSRIMTDDDWFAKLTTILQDATGPLALNQLRERGLAMSSEKARPFLDRLVQSGRLSKGILKFAGREFDTFGLTDRPAQARTDRHLETVKSRLMTVLDRQHGPLAAHRLAELVGRPTPTHPRTVQALEELEREGRVGKTTYNHNQRIINGWWSTNFLKTPESVATSALGRLIRGDRPSPSAGPAASPRRKDSEPVAGPIMPVNRITSFIAKPKPVTSATYVGIDLRQVVEDLFLGLESLKIQVEQFAAIVAETPVIPRSLREAVEEYAAASGKDIHAIAGGELILLMADLLRNFHAEHANTNSHMNGVAK